MPVLMLMSWWLALPLLFDNLSSLTPGMRGSCRTVFTGEHVESFDFEVKNILYHFGGPNRHIILVRLLGDKLEFTGVASGMSGSPCTINGKLLGALSYAFAVFAKEPIAGITPIGDMLPVLSFPGDSGPWQNIADLGPNYGLVAANQQLELTATAAAKIANADDLLQPIALGLASAGVPTLVQRQLFPLLHAAGLTAPTLSSTGIDMVGHTDVDHTATIKLGVAPPVTTFAAGSAVAAVLINGDADLSASGTVTLIDGERVYAFGHPFLGTGPMTLPMAKASVLHTLVSSQRSLKITRSDALIGTFNQDRSTALAGILGKIPQMLAVNGMVRTPRGLSAFAFNIARDMVLTPKLVAIALATGLAQRMDAAQKGTVHVDATLHLETHPAMVVHVHRVRAALRDESLLIMPALEVARQVAALWYTPFGAPPEMRIAVQAKLVGEVFAETIEQLESDKSLLRVGDVLQLVVRLRDVYGQIATATTSQTIPNDWANQTITFYALGRSDADRLEQAQYSENPPASYADLVRQSQNYRADGSIYLLATRQGTSLSEGGRGHAFLPSSRVLAWQQQTRAQVPLIATQTRISRPGSVMGSAQLQLRVATP